MQKVLTIIRASKCPFDLDKLAKKAIKTLQKISVPISAGIMRKSVTSDVYVYLHATYITRAIHNVNQLNAATIFTLLNW